VRAVRYDNPQTKAIAGIEWYTILPSYRVYCGLCTVETLETAKEQLSRYFCLIGLTERFEETLALAKVLLG